ncbi:MAG: hypothetical protein PUK40_04290 [Actinomycetaceae bacterium]|nr:hypothetical protein [Arcanobacterium sp.]MDD7505154.1 hypothetical protein [Actinomycetaceae bacterium]MDY6143856.1 hypothetical protein [Arcanobacterium sp.]
MSEGQHTQVRRLSDARQQVIDCLDTVYPEVDHNTWDITIAPRFDGVSELINAAK